MSFVGIIAAASSGPDLIAEHKRRELHYLLVANSSPSSPLLAFLAKLVRQNYPDGTEILVLIQPFALAAPKNFLW